jgi:hypothetical protein
MTVPEVCSRKWHNVNLKGRLLYGYSKRCVTFGVPVIRAFEQLLEVQRNVKPEGARWVLGWNADTARRWLNKVTAPEDDCKVKQAA